VLYFIFIFIYVNYLFPLSQVFDSLDGVIQEGCRSNLSFLDRLYL